ncbi:DUF4133 domain-containing protein [Sphingobacterium sp. WQ 366]|uniref:DUF4133 domain-containing protein n=1 Tax=Sphingobacterium bovistauri TaxID=2781959 RepID=A0ABS7Z399_9SPHI|nr:DUF4133 domain-containing protein [Sphingobacterium bovistauri]
MTAKSYPIYKGLQKPLTYKGFKGKYIYWALASLLIGLIIGSIAAALTNIIIAGLCSIATMGTCIALILHIQNKGLHQKKNKRRIYVQQTKLLIHYENNKQEPL